MNDSELPSYHWTRKLARRALCLPAVLLVAALLAGCGPKPPSVPAKTSASGEKASSTTASVEHCDMVMSSVVDIFQVQKLGLTTALTDGVARLNDWQRSCGGAQDPASIPELPEAVRSQLSDDQQSVRAAERFNLRDGEHLRDGMLFSAIVAHLQRDEASTANDPSSRESSELKSVGRIFDFVVRTIRLIPQHPQELPLTPYEVCLLGRGTVEDRVWIFVGLLKQLRIDAVILRPASADGSDPQAAALLVGVVLNNQVYLFEPRLGLPVPAGDNHSGAPAVATLAQAAQDAALLTQFDAGEQRYPIRAENLRDLEVLLATDAAWWAPRLAPIQDRLTTSRPVVIYDPLHDQVIGDQIIPGLWARIVAAGNALWDEPKMRVWPYPEEQRAAHAALGPNDDLAQLLSPMRAYKTVGFNRAKGQLVFKDDEEFDDPAAGMHDPGKAKRRKSTANEQWRARLSHLTGDFRAALIKYTEVRQGSRKVIEVMNKEQVSLADRFRLETMHTRALDDAYYWTACCKFDEGAYEVAQRSFEKYLEYQPEGTWRRDARYLLALSHAALGDKAAAATTLEAAEPDEPEYAGYRLLIRRWKASVP
jgi:hypothetical protein